MKLKSYQISDSLARVYISWKAKLTTRVSKARSFELYLSKNFMETSRNLSWTWTDQDELPKTLKGKCVYDIKCGFTYHFGLHAVDQYGKHIPFAIAQKWI